MSLVETAIRAFATFFATVGPVDIAILFAALTAQAAPAQRRAMAVKGVVVGTLILVVFLVFGADVLTHLGIGLPAMRTAGGVLLLLLAIDMVFGRDSGMTSATRDEASEAATRGDISVFPLATPLIAGPAAMGAGVLLTAEAGGDLWRQAIVLVALLAVMALTLALLLVATQVQSRIGASGRHLISRVIGVLLAALAIQFIFDGIGGSGLV